MTGKPSLLALDWGTSSVRAYLLGTDGAIVDTRAEPWGIMHTPGGDFAAALTMLTGPWRDRFPGLKAIASGMIGSAQGWREAPYCEAPAGAAELAAALVTVGTGNGALYLVPGVRRGGQNPNVMRGEETQILGALSLAPDLEKDSLVILPGTHSKWVSVQEARIIDFTTYMTGELFAVLRDHSILGRPAKAVQREAGALGIDWPAFERGASTVRDSAGGLSALLFSTRTLVLTGQMDPAHSLDYLSGLLIGEEFRIARPETQQPLTVIGDPALCARYQRAAALFGLSAPRLIENPCATGLWRIARMAGLA
ncbi:MAG TPA: 2-dehydro-3-deoxygalactonokinase [Acidocella sp.]|nr:2-dehydro-3-deoxygalactonokinase [Acidocella sp.]